ncbi:hypothetical protein ACXR2T_09365 [Leucobacter sp. HY1910]
MINSSYKVVRDPEIRQQVFERARLLAGPDEYRLAASWLARPDVLVIPVDNENHAGEQHVEPLRRACAVYPSARWYTVAIYSGEFSNPLEIIAPARALTWETDKSQPLGAAYAGQSFLFFSLEDCSAILFSEHEFALITGSAPFVEAYFGDLDEACRGFERALAEQRVLWARSAKMVEEFDRREAVIQTQIKLPR